MYTIGTFSWCPLIEGGGHVVLLEKNKWFVSSITFKRDLSPMEYVYELGIIQTRPIVSDDHQQDVVSNECYWVSWFKGNRSAAIQGPKTKLSCGGEMRIFCCSVTAFVYFLYFFTPWLNQTYANAFLTMWCHVPQESHVNLSCCKQRPEIKDIKCAGSIVTLTIGHLPPRAIQPPSFGVLFQQEPSEEN